MAKLNLLKPEIMTDPLTRGYAGMDSIAAANEINSIWSSPDTRTRDRASMTGDEVFQAIESQLVWDGLTDTQRDEFLSLCGRDILDPFGVANVDVVVSIFGGGSTTVSNLAALRVEDVPRAIELEIGFVEPGDVEYVRAN